MIFGVLVLGVIITGTFYINSHNQNKDIKALDEEIGKVKENLALSKEQNPSSVICGNFLCEQGETCSNCSSDCGACSEPDSPPAESSCGDGTCDDTETCNTCEDDCGICPLPEPFCGGKGTADEPLLICTPYDLYSIKEDLSLYYALKNDIDLDPDTLKNEEWYDSEKGWQPLGIYDKLFTGSLDGKNYTISNLTINREENNIGLFGYAGDSAQISNLVLEKVNITGGNYVGGLLGKSQDYIRISNISVTGIINGTEYVGGLVGKLNNKDPIDNSSVVYLSRVNVYVSGTNGTLGGLVGAMYYSEISESYSLGQVITLGDSSNEIISGVGGLIGYNTNSTIQNCFSRSEVSGTRGVGGLVGKNIDGILLNTYSTGIVSGYEHIGGLVGLAEGSEDISNYWDTQTSTLKDSVIGKGYLTEEMQFSENYKDWEFDKVWAIDEGKDYPYLINNPIK